MYMVKPKIIHSKLNIEFKFARYKIRMRTYFVVQVTSNLKTSVPQPQLSRCFTIFPVCYNFPVEFGITSNWNAYNYATTSTGML